MASPPTVASLHVHPVKSCRAVDLQQARVGELGFRDDRRWMVVDPGREFVSQRSTPALARITAHVDDDGLRLAAPGAGDVAVPVTVDEPRVTVTIWRDTCEAIDCGDEVAEFLTAALGRPGYRLVRIAEDFHRRLDPAYVDDPTRKTGFADGYPFLLTTLASLDDLNSRLDEPVPMNRFRPNIVVAGELAPFAEDDWKLLRIGDVVLDVVKPCARCVITTTDQASGERFREPLRTLATYRRGPSGGVIFGQNLAHRGQGTIRVGDAVEVLA